MSRIVSRALLTACVLSVFAPLATAGHQPRLIRKIASPYDTASRPDLFYNYYVAPPICADGVSAQMYLSPRPTPPQVGHVYVTYQPLMPHEYLYRHNRTYWRYHPGSGMTRTRVRWAW